MVIPSRNAISSADMSEEKDGAGFKKKKRDMLRFTTFYFTFTHFISHSKAESKTPKRSNTESVVATPGSSLAGQGGEESKWAGRSIRLEKKEKREEAVGLARWEKPRGEGNGRTKAGRGGGKEEAYSITWEKKERQMRRNAGKAWNKRGNKKGTENRGRHSGVRCGPSHAK